MTLYITLYYPLVHRGQQNLIWITSKNKKKPLLRTQYYYSVPIKVFF